MTHDRVSVPIARQLFNAGIGVSTELFWVRHYEEVVNHGPIQDIRPPQYFLYSANQMLMMEINDSFERWPAPNTEELCETLERRLAKPGVKDMDAADICGVYNLTMEKVRGGYAVGYVCQHCRGAAFPQAMAKRLPDALALCMIFKRQHLKVQYK